jgi:hypothetical protein
MTGWGLLAPEARQAAQWPPAGEATPPIPPQTQAAGAPAAVPGPAAVPAAAAVAAAPAAAPGAPVTGSIVPLPAPAAAPAKKTKGISSHKDKKAKEEEIRRTRQEVARKLKFLNSFDTPAPKPSHLAQKSKDKEKQKATASKTPPKQVRVGQFRDQKAARAKMAELQKKGEKVTLKQGKDQKGAYYEVLRQTATGSAKNDKLAQNANKTGSTKSKPAATENR